MAHDRMEVGWWIKSTDEETYGPVSRTTIWRFLEQAVVTPNTLVRHSTATAFGPLGDQLALRGGPAVAGGRSATRDRLAEVRPKRQKDRVALAEGSMRCMRHNRPATQVCMCCMGPYCENCRVNKRKPFFYCRKCQAGFYHARGGAFILDSFIMRMLQVGLALVVGEAAGAGGAIALGAPMLLFMFRDPLMKGAGLGKSASGLRAVQVADPAAPLTLGQGFIRSILLFVPFINLLDLSVPYRDPLCRRWGDRWAKTRVVYTQKKLEKIRAKATRLIQKKVGDCLPLEAPQQEQLVQLAG